MGVPFDAGASSTPPLRLVNFAQPSPSTLRLTFSHEMTGARAAVMTVVPATINAVKSFAAAHPVETKADVVNLSLDEKKADDEYSILLFVSDPACTAPRKCPPEYLEIVRQPQRWLEKNYSFVRPKGYSILGRRTVSVGDRTANGRELAPIVVSGKPHIDLSSSPSKIPPAIRRYPELVKATRVMRMLWKVPVRIGPTNRSYTQFVAQPFADKLREIRSGAFAVQCAGMRDIFLHALSGVGLRVRAAEGLNYNPPFSDLVTYGHSASEVWVSSLHRWILVDAWEGLVLSDRKGNLLSASGLRTVDPANVRVVELAPSRPRFVLTSNHGRAPFPTTTARLNRYTYTPYGSAPGYLAYFSIVEYRRVKIVPLR
jgi:hypothetical protein